MNRMQLVVNAGSSADTMRPAVNAPPQMTGAKNSLTMAMRVGDPISFIRELLVCDNHRVGEMCRAVKRSFLRHVCKSHASSTDFQEVAAGGGPVKYGM